MTWSSARRWPAGRPRSRASRPWWGCSSTPCRCGCGCAPAESLSELLTRLQDSQSELIAHQHLGLAEIQSLAGLGELFDTLVVFENYPVDRSALAQPVAGLALTSVEGHDATHYPLSLVAVPAERLRLRLQYRSDLFERSTVEAIGRRLAALLEAVVADPSQPIGRD